MLTKNRRTPVNIRLKKFLPVRARVVAWHEELGTANKTVEVPADGDLTVNFTSADFKKKKAKK